MTMTPAAATALAPASSTAEAPAQPADRTSAAAHAPAASAAAGAESADDAAVQEQEELEEQAHLYGRFILFNAVPSSLISGVVHFVLFVVLALTHMSPPPVTKMLQLNVAAGDKTDRADELSAQTIDVPTEQTAADE